MISVDLTIAALVGVEFGRWLSAIEPARKVHGPRALALVAGTFVGGYVIGRGLSGREDVGVVTALLFSEASLWAFDGDKPQAPNAEPLASPPVLPATPSAAPLRILPTRG